MEKLLSVWRIISGCPNQPILPNLPRRLKTHIAFSMFPILDTNLWSYWRYISFAKFRWKRVLSSFRVFQSSKLTTRTRILYFVQISKKKGNAKAAAETLWKPKGILIFKKWNQPRKVEEENIFTTYMFIWNSRVGKGQAKKQNDFVWPLVCAYILSIFWSLVEVVWNFNGKNYGQNIFSLPSSALHAFFLLQSVRLLTELTRLLCKFYMLGESVRPLKCLLDRLSIIICNVKHSNGITKPPKSNDTISFKFASFFVFPWTKKIWLDPT